MTAPPSTELDVRRARWLLYALHVPYAASAPLYAALDLSDPPEFGGRAPWWVALLLGVGLAALQVRHSVAATRDELPDAWPWTFAALILLAYVPVFWFGQNWQIAQMLVVASALMLLPVRGAVVMTVVIGIANGLTVPAFYRDFFDLAGLIVFGLFFTISYPLFGAGLYAAARFVRAVDELAETRLALAATVVDRERIRVSRDLHDLVGQSLAAVSLKGDLAVRLLDVDCARARREIAGMADTARKVLHDMRDVVGGVGLDLRDEVDGAVALLGAAAIAVDSSGLPAALTHDVEEALSWVVREGVTNVLRHSDATWCRIALFENADGITLELANDGARDAPDQGTGTGLTGLTERLAVLGGTVSAHREPAGVFRLTVTAPNREST